MLCLKKLVAGCIGTVQAWKFSPAFCADHQRADISTFVRKADVRAAL